MDVAQAKKILKEGRGKNRNFVKHEIMRGLQILAKYEEDVICRFLDHLILVSFWNRRSFDDSVSNMSEEDILQMVKLGWYYDEPCKCWAHHD